MRIWPNGKPMTQMDFEKLMEKKIVPGYKCQYMQIESAPVFILRPNDYAIGGTDGD